LNFAAARPDGSVDVSRDWLVMRRARGGGPAFRVRPDQGRVMSERGLATEARLALREGQAAALQFLIPRA
jgi:hypothetical protein